MGISIHYNGSLSNRSEIDKLRIELADISKEMGWNSVLVEPDACNRKTHPPVYGIIIDMNNGCEPLSFIFDTDGKLRSISALTHFDYPADNQLTVSIKTQYTSAEHHIVVIKLLRYIKKVYIKDLDVNDEGEYWKSSDEKRLAYLFGFLDKKIKEVRDVLYRNAEGLESIEDSNELADRLEDILKKQLGEIDGIERVNGAGGG